VLFALKVEGNFGRKKINLKEAKDPIFFIYNIEVWILKK